MSIFVLKVIFLPKAIYFQRAAQMFPSQSTAICSYYAMQPTTMKETVFFLKRIPTQSSDNQPALHPRLRKCDERTFLRGQIPILETITAKITTTLAGSLSLRVLFFSLLPVFACYSSLLFSLCDFTYHFGLDCSTAAANRQQCFVRFSSRNVAQLVLYN